MGKTWVMLVYSGLLLLGLVGCGQATPVAEPAAVESSAPLPATEVEEESSALSEVQLPPLLVETDVVCGTDGKPACPLVKPSGGPPEPIYERTLDQVARMEAFDALSLEEKKRVLDEGKIVCTQFIHDEEWEHEILPELVALVGQDAYDQWVEQTDTCGSIYDFVRNFQLDQKTLLKTIADVTGSPYPLEQLQAGLDKWCPGQ